MVSPMCAECPGKYCSRRIVDKSILPDYCPLKNSEEIVKRVVERYGFDEVRRLYLPATITEKETYEKVRGVTMAVRPRVKEVAEFARKIGAKNIGIAFCGGLNDEASRINEIFKKNGFKVCSVVCSCGNIDKTQLGVSEEHKIHPHVFEAACSPLLQAELLNEAETDINVIVGLCVGHDILFTKYSNAPVTTLVVKDRLTGHNPIISLYTSYHKRLIQSTNDEKS